MEKAKQLQSLHEDKLVNAVEAAISQMMKEQGEIPAPFAFFVMGSAGRKEQIHDSDQDHGIVFDGNEHCLPYFLELGERIVERLEKAGYERCIGGVMASKQRWCRSFISWKEQLEGWLQDDSFEHLRHLLTFFDARPIEGEKELVWSLKGLLFEKVKTKPYLLKRFADNTGRLPQGLNLFGQLLVEQQGEKQGLLNMKQQVLFPFVNGMRLLALKDEMFESSTLDRFEANKRIDTEIVEAHYSFKQLIEKRAQWKENVGIVTYVKPDELKKDEQKQLKRWIREGRRFYEAVQKKIEAGD